MTAAFHTKKEKYAILRSRFKNKHIWLKRMYLLNITSNSFIAYYRRTTDKGKMSYRFFN